MDLLGFITLGIYTPLEAQCVLLTKTVHELPVDAGQLLSCNCVAGSFQLFLHSDQPLSEGEIIRSAVSAHSRGEAALSTPEAVVASRTD